MYSLRLKVPHVHYIKYRKYGQAKTWKQTIPTLEKNSGQYLGVFPFSFM